MLTDEEFKRFLKALGTRIKTLRKDKNFNMRDIMIATGYYDTQWRKYEAGGSMNLQSLMKVAMALDVSLAELFDGLSEWPKLSVAEIEKKAVFKSARGRPNLDGDRLEKAPASSKEVAKLARILPKAKHSGVSAATPLRASRLRKAGS